MLSRSTLWLGAALSLLAACSTANVPADGGASDGGPAADMGLVCTSAAQCDDRVFCNGLERCAPSAAGANALGCAPALSPPCGSGLSCDEAAAACRAGDAAVGEAGCDADGDGVAGPQCGGMDCDDNDPDRFPGNRERCDGASLRNGMSPAAHDEDCNPCTVNDPLTLRDGDGDGDRFPAALCANPWLSASAPVGCDINQVSANATAHTEVGTDCDDAMPAVNRSAPEVCGNHVDDNCNGVTDEDAPGTAYRDVDNDRHGDPAVSMSVPSLCGLALGWSVNHDDCDDTRPETYAGAREQCDRRDNDCSLPGAMAGGVDPSEDVDNDGYSPAAATCLGAGEGGALATAFPKTDCDDAVATTHPGAAEVCDRVDNDCSAGGGAAPAEDMDNDGHSAPAAMCAGRGDTGATATTFPKDDCDDANPDAHFGHVLTDPTVCGPIGDNCDGTVDVGRPCTAGGYCYSAMTCRSLPVPAQVVAGANHTCAVNMDGTVRCWGDNTHGQLGDGTTTQRLVPTVVPGLSGVRALSLGNAHSCAVLTDNTVRCWGANANGQLGDGTTAQRLAPTVVPGLSGASQVAAGDAHTCVALMDNTVQCWGANTTGQLGDGTTTERHVPTLVSGLLLARQLAAGSAHTCALRATNGVSCWGDNTYGQLGDGTHTQRLVPAMVSGLGTVFGIGAGLRHSCSFDVSSSVLRCWGDNTHGQLGDGTTTQRVTPTAVPGAMSITAGGQSGFQTCVVFSGHTVGCWGDNTYGQLGDSTHTQRNAPTLVTGLTTANSLGLGAQHSCALLTDNTIRCWGDNTHGQLGDGTTTARLTPALVSGF